jgi:hypothetical protein
MSNPYHGRPSYTFWKQGVTNQAISGVDPVVHTPFTFTRDDIVATAGSCFAQHISRTLVKQGCRYLVTENFHCAPGISDENFAVFPARFGNLYTARQLLQLLERAYGKREVTVDFWIRRDAAIIDPFRPRIQVRGFGSVANLRSDRDNHLDAVRKMFEHCNVFIFTLGLTEAWISPSDGSVYPLAPGAVAVGVADADCMFINFSVSEVVDDLLRSLDWLFEINPSVRVILTVSPVPLVATCEDRHVLVSTVASKSILRAAVDEVVRRKPKVAYFPSYEIVVGPQSRGSFYADDLREITPGGVDYVMRLFTRHYLAANTKTCTVTRPRSEFTAVDEARMAELGSIICDEEAMEE